MSPFPPSVPFLSFQLNGISFKGFPALRRNGGHPSSQAVLDIIYVGYI